jgi:AcrR family transcriptional regulator
MNSSAEMSRNRRKRDNRPSRAANVLAAKADVQIEPAAGRDRSLDSGFRGKDVEGTTADNAREDRRIGRTRQSLHHAMIALVLEKGFEAVTIKDIVERANVGRSTFYTHYASKEDLLTGEMAELRALLSARQREALGRRGGLAERCLGFSGALFEHAKGYRDVYRALLGERGSTVIMSRMRGLLSDLVRQDLAAIARSSGKDIVLRSAVVEFLVGALMSTLAWQAERKAGPSPAEIDRMFRALAIPAIAAASPIPTGSRLTPADWVSDSRGRER